MQSLLSRLALLVLAAAPLGAAPVVQDDVGARIDAVISDWLADEERSEHALSAELAKLGPKSEPYLCEFLEAPRSGLPPRSLAAALGQVGSSARAIEAIATLLDSEEAHDRACAAGALGELKLAGAMPHLLSAIDSPSASVRAACAAGILEIHGANPDLDVVAQLNKRERTLEHKEDLALVLGRIATPDAREVLRELISRWDDESSILAGLSGLWISCEREDATSIRAALTRSNSTAVTRKACLLLGKLKDRAATRPLIDLLYAEHRGLVSDAHWALREITGLHLSTDPTLWESWWERVGQKSHPPDNGD